MKQGDHTFRIVIYRRAAILGASALAVALITACSGANAKNQSSAPGTSAAASTSFTMAIGSEPQSLDPAKDDNGDGLYAAELLYAPLINETDQATFTPALATSWHYVGTGNEKFELTIRSGAKFSNGQPVTASAVAASLMYTSKGTGPAGSVFTGLTAKAISSNTVALTTTAPVANFPEFLSQRNLVGDIVCPSSLKAPQALASQPCGAGPYVLDSSATTPGTKYVFTANPRYYDPSQIRFKTMVLEVISDPSSQLDAVRTGQVQLISENDTTLDQLAPAKAAGMQVDILGETGFVPVWIMDRFGQLDKPLGNVLVRQALNYAVDRAAIAKAVFGPLGAVDDEAAVPGWNGYDPALANYYTYDPAKAKQLLAKAGYPHGFSLSVLYVNSQTQAGEVLQALVQQWGAIGVKLTLVPEDGFPPFSAAQATKKYPAFMLTWGAGDITGSADLLWVSHSGANAFYATSPALLKLFNAAQVASAAQSAAAFKAFDDYVITQAWFITTSANKDFLIAAKGVKGLPAPGNAQPAGFNLLEVHE